MAPARNQTASSHEPTSQSRLSLYLPPASPLFTYSPHIPDRFAEQQGEGAVLTGVWVGVSSAPTGESGQSNGGGWGNSTNPASGAVQSGNTKQTKGNAALTLSGFHLTSFTPFFDIREGFHPALQTSPAFPAQAWLSNQTYEQPFGISSLILSIPCAKASACPSIPFTFRGAQVGTEIAPPSAAGSPATKRVIADDASGLVEYRGWSPVAKERAAVAVGPGDYGGTLSMTAASNASAMVRFRGTSVLLRGVTAPTLGRFSVLLDGNSPQTLNAQDEVTTHDVPLYFASALDAASVHQLSLLTLPGSDEKSGTGAILDRVEIWGADGGVGFMRSANENSGKDGQLVIPPRLDMNPSSPTSGTGSDGEHTGGTLPGGETTGGAPSAGAIIGIIIGILAALGLLYYSFRRYGSLIAAKPAPSPMNEWDAANNLQVMKQEAVLVSAVAKQRYVYPGMIAHSELK